MISNKDYRTEWGENMPVLKEQFSYIAPSPMKRDWEGDKAQEQNALAVRLKSINKFILENSIEFYLETGVSNPCTGYILPIQGSESFAAYVVNPDGGIRCTWGVELEEARTILARVTE